MYKHYFTLAIRHLQKHRLFSGIKIIGLTIATASCLLIGLYILHELNYDSMHENAGRIIKANMEYRFAGETVMANVCGNKAAPAFTRDFPEIESGVRLMKYSEIIKTGDQIFEEENLFYGDSTFFSIFSFPLISGDQSHLLDQPYEVVLSESTARKYFGNGNPLGKFLRIGTSQDYKVTGVMKDPPEDTHIKPDLLVSFTSLNSSKNETWWNANYATYFLLYPGVDLQALQAKIPDYMRAHSKETGITGDDYMTFYFEKFSDLHLRSQVPGNFEPAGNIKYIYILAVVGLLILIIACITYINLTTATSTERSREIGVQKVMGVSKSHLIAQNLMESGVIMLITIVLGFVLARFALPFFNQLFDRSLVLNNFYTMDKMSIILVIAASVALLSGIYPAFVIARYDPISALKGTQQNQGRKPQWLKKSLIVFQFSVSIILTISALTLYRQMQYVKNKNLGFTKDLVISLPADRTIRQEYDALKTQLVSLPEVSSVTNSYDSPVQIRGGYTVGQNPSGDDQRPVTALPAGLDFLQTMSIDLAAGQDFNLADMENYEKASDDSTIISRILINEALANAWGWNDQEAVGQMISFNGKRSLVKGVVQNFHFASLHQPIEPLVIFPQNWGRQVLIRLSDGDLQQALDKVKETWSSLITHRPFSYHFIDEEFAKMYRFENQNAQVTYVFTWLAIFLACLGLFGVASFGFAQRTKEIGIRKVLGSSVSGIFGLLAREYVVLIGIALLIAVPLAWMAMNQWLEQFAYRINVQWWMFVLAGLLAFIIAGITLSFQGIKAAMMNPVESLKQD
ncbi:MAG: ABC transporter permease [Saprospiraceae bacterium]|nr:ABC transporter permease [Saprospiraceae bacterium]